ncbi:hypothetical protein B0H19DRAFT_1251290 [Mycena capillaripes]|nr:hypothetical protein B0H19DRAFT_1251290 [Mycena capillaripes]
MGPRTRNTSRNSLLPPPSESSASQSSRESTLSPRDSTLSSSGPSPRYSAPSSADHSDSKNLAAITEGEYESPPAPENEPPPPPPLRVPEVIPEEPLNVTSVPKVAGLTPPIQIKFDPVPVKWKGLPLEAALWTFNSKELQELVSRAIRKSSQESFIRVLSVENLDKSLPAELDRLNTLKSMTQSKYRFTVHRRTMLLQALHSFSGYNDKEKDAALVAQLTGQLSQTTAECDQLLEDLLQIADQVGQITHLLDIHWSSALAIALRKLNTSYGRRTKDLLSARAKIETLQAELNDAWQQAEKLAREMDDFDVDVASDEDEEDVVIEVAEVISLNHRKSPSASSQVVEVLSLNHRKSPSGSSHLSLRPLEDALSLDAISRMHSLQSQTTGTEQAQLSTPPSPSLMKLPTPTPSEAEQLLRTPTSPSLVETPSSPSPVEPSPVEPSPIEPSPVEPSLLTADDTASIHSARSARSTRSVRSMRSFRSGRSNKSARTARSQRTTEASRVSTVSAARRRSQRTSMSSLRMPPIKTQGRKGSHPPVPSLPTLSPATPDRRNSTIESFLDFGRDGSDSDTDDTGTGVGTSTGYAATPRRTSIDDIEVVARSPVPMIQTRDDIHVMPSRSATEKELVAPKRSQFSLDHQHPFANEEPVHQSIPSIWLLQDAPKTPAERVESMMRDRGNTKMGSFQRLKSLTKRYSLPFPVVTLPRSKSGGRNATTNP